MFVGNNHTNDADNYKNEEIEFLSYSFKIVLSNFGPPHDLVILDGRGNSIVHN